MTRNSEDIRSQTVNLAALRLPIWVFDCKALRFVWANSEALALWNASDMDELCRRDLSADITPSIRTRLSQHAEDLRGTTDSVAEHWTFYPKGEPRSFECVLSSYADAPEGCESWLLVHALKESDRSDADTLYRANALMHTSVMVSVYRACGERVYCNPAARSAIGGGNITLADHFEHSRDWLRIKRHLERFSHVSTEASVHTRNGLSWHGMTVEMCPDPVSGELSYLISEFDITEQREAQQRVHELAYTDTLTGLRNRAYLLKDLPDRLNRAMQQEQPLSVLFIDLNRFKLINDSLGHHVGDALLLAVADRVRQCAADAHLVARLGGDEFTILIGGADARKQARQLADRIQAALEHPLIVEGHELLITASIGISCFPDHGKTVSELMRCADIAMYSAKMSGGGYAEFLPAMANNGQDRLQLESDLRSALINHEFDVFYQPKVHAQTGEVTGMEALIRWFHPVRGMVSPLEFISIAEETDMITQITEFVLTTAMQQQCVWREQGHELSIAVNISPRDFLSGSVTGLVERALQSTGCDAQFVELEITESMLMADNQKVQEILNGLKAHGIKLSLDDFGTGYSNLGYLHKFPLDSIKADRSFLADGDRLAVLEMIISMGKTFNLSVVAEGVENVEQLEWLMEHGCDNLQGFLFSPPVPAEQATEYLKAHKNWLNTWPRMA